MPRSSALRRVKSLVSTQRLDESVSNKSGALAVAEELFPMFLASRERAQTMEHWYRNELEQIGQDVLPNLPASAGGDLMALRASAPTPWAKMIADALSQNLVIDGIRQKDSPDDAPALRLWQRNGLDSRQRGLWDGAIRHGKSFALVGQAVGRLDGERTAFIRGKSALNFDAFYRDDYDEWPEYAMEAREQRDDDGSLRWRIDFWDDNNHYRMTCEHDGKQFVMIDWEPHNMGIVPVVRVAGNIDLTGRCTGEIEPFVRLFQRVDQSTMDRLVVQRYGAFIIRFIAGMETPKTDEEKRAAAMALAITDLLVSPDKDTKFGALPATPLDGFIRAGEEDVRHLGATSQTPLFHMLGLSDNVGAEGLAAAEAAHFRKRDGWQTNLGEAAEQFMRLAGWAAGDEAVANDFESRVHWKDTRAMSFQSYMQGLGVAAQQLGVPGEAMWPWIPGWEQADTVKARQLRTEQERRELMEATVLAAANARQSGGVNGGGSTGAAR